MGQVPGYRFPARGTCHRPRALMRGGSVIVVTVAPGNPGMELDGIRTTQISPSNHAALIEFRTQAITTTECSSDRKCR